MLQILSFFPYPHCLDVYNLLTLDFDQVKNGATRYYDRHKLLM